MSRYFIKLCYDGTGFHGWQRQPNGITIQQTLEDAMSMMFRAPVRLTGAGRTDTGVHADEFYAHFDLNYDLPKLEREKMTFRLNRFLGGDIAIMDILPVAADAHARFSARSRTYRYCITSVKNPFRRNYTHFMHGPIDWELMNEGAAVIMGYDDFTSFSKVDTDTKTNICRVTAAAWEQEGREAVFTITADRFLRNMVRAIVGTLLQLGTGRISLEQLGLIIENHNRSDAGDSVAAKGLTLARIIYPEDIFIVE
ncbi:MAG: tRNA pseudouridine(38-40) synthase TruA [Bacteroidota bacterium]